MEFMTSVQILKNGQINLPAKLRQIFGLVAGDFLEPTPTPKGILLKPKKLVSVDDFPETDALWFWTDEWQKGEREADEDIKAGRVSKTFDNAEDMIKALKAGKL